MRYIFFIIVLFVYSSSIFSNTPSSDLNKNTYVQEEDNNTQIAFGGLAALFKLLAKLGTNTKPGKFIDDIDNIFPSTSNKPKFKPLTQNKKSSFDWGFNPNPAAIRNGLKELRENDPEGYQEITEWNCPEKITNSPFLEELSKEEKCVSYHMRCNVVVSTDNAMGSGFFYNSNIIITNYHVVDDSSGNVKIEPFISNKKYPGEIIAIDKVNDFAAIQLEPYSNQRLTNDDLYSVDDLFETLFNKFQPCFLADESPDIGENVLAIGHPKGRKFFISKGQLQSYRDKNFQNTNLSSSNLHWIEMNAYIAPGSSGGPLYHEGYVIGVNTRGVPNTSENYALHFNKLKKFLNYNEIDSNLTKFSFDKDNSIKKLKLILK